MRRDQQVIDWGSLPRGKEFRQHPRIFPSPRGSDHDRNQLQGTARRHADGAD